MMRKIRDGLGMDDKDGVFGGAEVGKNRQVVRRQVW